MDSTYAPRLSNQQIAATRFSRPEEIVAWLGAMQAQDYLGTLWAVGLRLPGSTETAVEQALNERTIVRTWPMRGTLHIVAAADVRWMLDLLAPRRLAQSAGRRKQLGIDGATLAHSREVCREALQGGKQLARPAMFALLQSHGIATTGQRGIHILGHLAQEGVLCLGARAGKQFTFTLLDEWAPEARPLERDAAWAELARRYFTSHGPATVHDFAWWTGQTLGDARRGLAAAASHLIQEHIDGKTYWMAPASDSQDEPTSAVYFLPGFDEYMLGYKDRSAILAAEHAPTIHPGANGMLNATLVVDGRIQGVWRRTLKKKSVLVTIRPFAALPASRKLAATAAAERYARFLGLSLELEWQE
jgi:hypothetical protein